VDDEIAQRLFKLVQAAPRLYDQSNMTDYHHTGEEIKKIGRQLAAAGGDERMQAVAAGVQHMGALSHRRAPIRLRGLERGTPGL
jgi:hypothetical protein